MAEQKSWLKVQVSGMVDGKEIDTENYEGKGVIVLIDTGTNAGCGIMGEWDATSLGTAIDCIKKAVGGKMFKDALALYLANEMAKAFVGMDDAADEEAENEKKAAEAAMEAYDGEET